MKGKFAFSRRMTAEDMPALQAAAERLKGDLARARALGLIHCRIYTQEIEGLLYAFQFYMLDEGADPEALFATLRGEDGLLKGWAPARHVYEFKLHPGDCYDNLKSQGIIIGVREGKLDEYVRLHDEQPQIIHDLCYQNGFRKSSIFVTELHKQYLLQFQDFYGQEDPALYENETYLEWLRVTGECQQPLAGEEFWKPMKEIFVV